MRTQFPIANRIFGQLIPDARFRVVDAGAAGAGEAVRWGFLGSNLELHGFEADSAACEKLLRNAPPGATVCYYNAFLGKTVSKRLFFMAHAYNNSFYPTDYSWYARKRSLPPCTGPASEQYEIAKTIEVESVSLDDWAERNSVPAVDYLKVDIEGAELELMQASPRMMSGILGVSVDVIFHEDWIGAPTFADVDHWLRSQKFVLFDLTDLKRGNQFNSPFVAPRAHELIVGQVACANAIYFRDPLVKGADPMDAASMLKLATIAEVHGHVEFAFELLKAAERSGDAKVQSGAVAEVERMALQEYRALVEQGSFARWRNPLIKAIRRIVPKPLWMVAKKVSDRIGLRSNPLYPNKL